MNPILKIIFEVWDGTIRDEYLQMRIDSEVNLVTILCHRLVLRLSKEGIDLLLRPSMRSNSMFCNTDFILHRDSEVIAMIEVKYLTRVERDAVKASVCKLYAAAAKREDPIYCFVEHFDRDAIDSRKFSFTQVPCFVWAGVYDPEKLELKTPFFDFSQVEKPQGTFVELHAMTKGSESPVMRKWVNGAEQFD